MVEHKFYDRIAEQVIGDGIAYEVGAGDTSRIKSLSSSGGRAFQESWIKNSRKLTTEQKIIKKAIDEEIDRLHSLDRHGF